MKKALLIMLFFTVKVIGQQTCSTSQLVTAGTYSVNSIDGTDIPLPVCASGGGGATNGKWYKYIPTNDYTVTVTTDFPSNGNVDNRVHIYNGDCGSLNCIAGDDDSGAGYLCLVSFQVVQGSAYYIAFDNKWSSNGFTFELIETPAAVFDTTYVNFMPEFISTISGSYKIAVSDMNGDFLDDIITVSDNNVQIHYQSNSGVFSAVNYTTSTVPNMPSWSMAIADINKDGYNDLLYGGGSGVSFLKSNGNGTGYLHTTTLDYVFSQRSNFIDINNDGNLDAFVCHDVAPNVFYLNDGNGNLTFQQGGIGDHPNGGNYGSIWVDYNNDGLSDLFIAKCRGGQNTAKINELHRNNGNGTFTNVSQEANLSDSVQTWSSAWNDFDNDGDMDLVVGASSFTDGGHKVMKNNGDGTFTNVTVGSGWDVFTGLSIEYVSYDFNNDGFADVFTNDYIMYNNGDFTFTPIQVPMDVAAVGDLNNDGFLDVQVGNNIYYSSGNSNNWIKINLEGVQSNINGIGARVEVYGSWGKQIRDVQSGIGFRHMGTLNVHFGIGPASTIDSIIVRWPSGQIDLICFPLINTNIFIKEGNGTLPISNFIVSSNTINAGESVSISDLTINCPNYWVYTITPSAGWEFINGSAISSQNPQIQFNNSGIYTVTQTAANSNGPSLSSHAEIINVLPTAGTDESNIIGLTIHPNPTSEKLNIDLTSEFKMKEIKILSSLGTIIQVLEPAKTIDVSTLNTGIYYIEICSIDHEMARLKFIKD
jgi:hypothetical protein